MDFDEGYGDSPLNVYRNVKRLVQADAQGVPMVKMEDLKELGFNFVTVHYLEKGSMWGMLLYGKHNYQNQNAMFSVHHQMDGLTEEEKKEAFNIHGTQWLDLEKEFQTIK